MQILETAELPIRHDGHLRLIITHMIALTILKLDKTDWKPQIVYPIVDFDMHIGHPIQIIFRN